MGGFLSSLLTGSDPTLSGAINTSNQVAGYGTGTGRQYINNAGNYFNQLLSGNPATIAQVMSPQIQAVQGQAQQAKQTAAQFGNRSGGTNAGMQTLDDQTRAQINNLINQNIGGAATQEATIGQNLLNTGLTANQQAATESEMAMQNAQNSILGGIVGGLGKNLGTMITGGLGMVPGLSAVI